MNFLDIFFLSLLFLSFILIFFIVGRKFFQLKAVNLDIITKDIQDKQKKELLEKRLSRKIKDSIFPKGHKSFLLNLQNRLDELSRKNKFSYDINLIKKSKNRQDDDKVDEHTQNLIKQIEENIKNEDFFSAEESCFALLKLDKDNIKILEYLADIYFSKSDIIKAREIYEYIISILTRDKLKARSKEIQQKVVKYRIKIAEFYFNEKNYKKTTEILDDAFLVDENNPKILNLLIEAYVNLQNKFMADRMLKKMVEANPENSKIQEFKEKIQTMFSR